jgi:hypothetical protein
MGAHIVHALTTTVLAGKAYNDRLRSILNEVRSPLWQDCSHFILYLTRIVVVGVACCSGESVQQEQPGVRAAARIGRGRHQGATVQHPATVARTGRYFPPAPHNYTIPRTCMCVDDERGVMLIQILLITLRPQ